MILTLTANPAIDRVLTVDRLAFEDRAYIRSNHESPGGRGINAACVIHSFGGRTKAVAPSGGESGQRFEKLLSCCGFPLIPVPIRNPIRTNLTVTDSHGLTVNLNETGPELDASELAALERAVEEHLQPEGWLMLCGSLPPGVPCCFYRRLIEAARHKDVRTLIDTDGEPLREAVEAGPTVVAPNQQEAERLLNRALITRSHFLEAAARIRQMGPRNVVVSLGSRGAVASLESGGLWEALPPRIDAVCPIGAGDALAAAFCWAAETGSSYEDAVRWGVAAGTASARLPGMRFASRAQTGEIYSQVELRRAE